MLISDMNVKFGTGSITFMFIQSAIALVFAHLREIRHDNAFCLTVVDGPIQYLEEFCRDISSILSFASKTQDSGHH